MKKILKILGIFIVLILLALVAIPYLFQDKIVSFVKDTVNKELNAKADFSDYGLSVFSSFPDLTFKIEDFYIDGQGAFDSIRLVSVEEANIVLDLKSVIKGEEYKVKELEVNKLLLNAIVLEDGTANYDIMKEDFDTDTMEVTEDTYPYQVLLDSYAINNSKIIYDNRSLGAYLEIDELFHSGSGNLTDAEYKLSTKTSAGKAIVNYEDIKYLKDAELEVDAKFGISDEFRQFDLLENSIRINDLKLMADGQVYMPEDGVDLDLNYRTTETDLLTILSLIPRDYLPDLTGVQTNGTVNIDGNVKGKYDDNSLPALVVNGKIENGFLQYPDLPEAVRDIQIRAAIESPQGNDFSEMKVDISQFHMDLADNPIDATLLVTSALSDDPYIKSSVKSSIDFASIRQAIPLDETDKLNGILTADVDLEGTLSAIEKEDYSNFEASGTANLIGFNYSSDSLPYDVEVKTAYLNFSPQQLDLTKFDSKIGESEISATGKIDNYIAWFLNDETLKGRFDVNAGFLNMADFIEEEEVGSIGEESDLGVIEVPGNIDVIVNASVDGIRYENLDMKNVKGQIAIADKRAEMKNVRMDLLNGTVVVNGAYDTKDVNAPRVDFNYNIDNMAIKESAMTFNTVNTLAPIAKQCVGYFDSGMSFSSTLDENMEPIYESITGEGNAFTESVLVENFAPLAKIASTLKLDEWTSKTIKNAKVNFEFEDGRVSVKPFDIKIDGMDANVAGSTGFMGDMDYNMNLKVPTSKLGGDINNWMGNVLGKVNELGANTSIGEFVNVNLKITGTITDPKVKPVFEGMEGKTVKEVVQERVEETIKEELIDPAKEKAKAEADKIIADAQAQVDKLMAEAQKAADLTRSEGDKLADKILSEAKNPIAKIAAKAAADKTRKEADKKAIKILDEAKKKTDGILQKAQDKADAKLQ